MNSPIRHRPFSAIAAVLALAIGTTLPAAAQTTIGASGGSFVQSWGKDAGTPNTQTYGQTITVPTDYVLTSFSFWLGRTSTNFPDPSDPSLSFMAYVYAWNEGLSMATGAALYTSGAVTHNATPATPFTEYMSRPAACHWSRGTPTRSSSARRGYRQRPHPVGGRDRR